MIYELIEALENNTHAKVNFSLNNEKVNCDLGICETVDNKLTFVTILPSRIILKTNLSLYEVI